MMAIPFEWLTYLSLVACLLLAVSLVMIAKRNKQHNEALREKNRQLEKLLSNLEQQLDLLNKGTIGMGRRLMTTEKRLNQTMERQDSLENKESEQLSFKQAAKLFERGLEMDNVIEKVGITRSEAKLVDMFQQKQMAED